MPSTPYAMVAPRDSRRAAYLLTNDTDLLVLSGYTADSLNPDSRTALAATGGSGCAPMTALRTRYARHE